ncbi:FKBP-type peptidyl-prolyl cis-trans isomerase [Hymenobacter sp. GOD-10R]|uniref:FKBP-type peptidyl-prolyl cis-trans isomerase n=1 Tax=Hymenobacter sp. GOD-10R TaxID=3093922 RepID=UPI002D79DE63|nr:FKBP-type peptidyl-prolyl cis-trans isomerase [Hymenobacter sp. GOD-10R]WRQ28034.1 FKBP-type peptidyl-prolyl cis-trans isomerase [Hymenobacter sp. GOD-10R]
MYSGRLLIGTLAAFLSLAAQSTLAQSADTLRTASGVRYVIRQKGTGNLAQPGDRLTMRYTGYLPNGRIFDASVADGAPIRFRAGRGEVIRGWDELALLLPAGTRAHAWIPAALAYGHKGNLDPDDERRYIIPPDTDLEFELEVVRIK